jgi:hypothetical protein
MFRRKPMPADKWMLAVFPAITLTIVGTGVVLLWLITQIALPWLGSHRHLLPL